MIASLHDLYLSHLLPLFASPPNTTTVPGKGEGARCVLVTARAPSTFQKPAHISVKEADKEKVAKGPF
ncbi:hypothetical protein D6792_03090 [Candidatus Parcubacteria bacterium]|nr:MAG: hypothetical protein D6792_03090 [Candidatus Parcubacteria bacterium]